MKLGKNAIIVTSDFWYDLFEGGYIEPALILAQKDDIATVENAIEVLRKFRSACEDIIEYM